MMSPCDNWIHPGLLIRYYRTRTVEWKVVQSCRDPLLGTVAWVIERTRDGKRRTLSQRTADRYWCAAQSSPVREYQPGETP